MIIDYLKFPESTTKSQTKVAEPEKSEVKKETTSDSEFDEYGHVIEIYDFPTNFKNENIFEAIRETV